MVALMLSAVNVCVSRTRQGRAAVGFQRVRWVYLVSVSFGYPSAFVRTSPQMDWLILCVVIVTSLIQILSVCLVLPALLRLLSTLVLDLRVCVPVCHVCVSRLVTSLSSIPIVLSHFAQQVTAQWCQRSQPCRPSSFSTVCMSWTELD